MIGYHSKVSAAADGPVKLMAESPPMTGDQKQWLRKLEAGVTLFQEGDIDRRLFVLIDGRVSILRAGALLAEIGVAESFIGEVSALTGRPRSATARTSQPSTLLVVDRIDDLFQHPGNWGIRLARELANRLDRMNDRFGRLQQVLDLTRREGGVAEDVTKTLEAVVEGDPEERRLV